ncbi:MAG: hypothetical protein GC179_00885 [Anaerolineaceae bacterium]|nr:hypothetical protein [Anaerolineaceae bacterium]
MTSGMTPLKRFAVRATLVVGSTMATIVGAETLATLDIKPTSILPANPADTAVITPAIESTKTVISSAPTIVIIRHSPVNNPVPKVTNSTPINIQPPRPITIVQPPPVVIVQSSSPAQVQSQAPSQPSTQSSR